MSDASNQEVLPTRQGILSLAGDPYMTSSNMWDFNPITDNRATSQLPLSLYKYGSPSPLNADVIQATLHLHGPRRGAMIDQS